MDIRGIKYFISAAECLNFTRAARECFITQTAMSQHIANMEKELGFQLFLRNNRNVELTPAGRDFYEQMKLVVHGYDNAVRHSRNLSSGGEVLQQFGIPMEKMYGYKTFENKSCVYISDKRMKTTLEAWQTFLYGQTY